MPVPLLSAGREYSDLGSPEKKSLLALLQVLLFIGVEKNRLWEFNQSEPPWPSFPTTAPSTSRGRSAERWSSPTNADLSTGT